MAELVQLSLRQECVQNATVIPLLMHIELSHSNWTKKMFYFPMKVKRKVYSTINLQFLKH